MKVKYNKRFLKEMKKLPGDIRNKIEHFAFSILPESTSLESLGNVEKMKGYSAYYKVRFGMYRIGLRKDDDFVYVERVLHRREIYRYFP